MTIFTESLIEKAALDWLSALSYQVSFGPDLAADGLKPERASYQEVILEGRLREALRRTNPSLSEEALQEAFRQITHPNQPSLLRNNHAFHRLLVDGVVVDYRDEEGRLISGRVWAIDWEDVDNNDWLAANQFTVAATYQNNPVNRRPDMVIFVNGLPLAVIELKNPADENATIWIAFNQLQTYKEQIPALFVYNEVLVISDGLNARIGSLTAGKEWFLPWKTIEGDTTAPTSATQLEVLLRGVF